MDDKKHDFEELIEALREKLRVQLSAKQMTFWLMSSADRAQLPQRDAGEWQPFVGHPILFSPFVESGTLRKVTYTPWRPELKIDEETRWDDDWLFTHRSDRFLNSYFMYSAVPAPVDEWRRGAGETLLAWGQRLHDEGLLDVPDIRWAYQTQLQASLWRSFWNLGKRFLGRLF